MKQHGRSTRSIQWAFLAIVSLGAMVWVSIRMNKVPKTLVSIEDGATETPMVAVWVYSTPIYVNSITEGIAAYTASQQASLLAGEPTSTPISTTEACEEIRDHLIESIILDVRADDNNITITQPTLSAQYDSIQTQVADAPPVQTFTVDEQNRTGATVEEYELAMRNINQRMARRAKLYSVLVNNIVQGVPTPSATEIAGSITQSKMKLLVAQFDSNVYGTDIDISDYDGVDSPQEFIDLSRQHGGIASNEVPMEEYSYDAVGDLPDYARAAAMDDMKEHTIGSFVRADGSAVIFLLIYKDNSMALDSEGASYETLRQTIIQDRARATVEADIDTMINGADVVIENDPCAP